MKVVTEDGFNIEINEKDNAATLISIPRIEANFIVPTYVEYRGQKYPITSLNFSYNHYRFNSISFPEDSEVLIFQENTFNGTYLKSLQIPPKLECLPRSWCCCLNGLVNIEISPKNHNFIYYNNQYLLAKSDTKSDQYDILVFVRRDIRRAVIPSQVKIIQYSSLSDTKYLKTVTFQEESQIKSIDTCSFCNSSVKRIEIPSAIDQLDVLAFLYSNKLKKLEFFAKKFTCQINMFSYCTSLQVVTFPNVEKLFVKGHINNFDNNVVFFVNARATVITIYQ